MLPIPTFQHDFGGKPYRHKVIKGSIERRIPEDNQKEKVQTSL